VQRVTILRVKARLERAEAPGTDRLRRQAPRSLARGAEPRPLELQRLAGNRATTGLIQREVATAPATTTRPTLQKGDTEQMVGVLQEKLRVLGEKLNVDGEFGNRTKAAVTRFQGSHPPLTKNGIADDATWAALDALVAGGERQADGSLSPVGMHSPADPTLRLTSDSGTKPRLEKGAKGVAVAQLHEQLNQVGASLPTAATLDLAGAIEFTDDTERAVRDFQRAHRPLGVDGIVGNHTWAALDAIAPGTSMGHVSETTQEKARGKDFVGVPVEYDWAVEPNQTAPQVFRVRVRYDYQDDPAMPLADKAGTVNALLNGIKSIWNVFKAVEQPTGAGPARPDVRIEFDPQVGTPADKTVVLHGGVGHSNTANYFITPGEDLAGLAAHEFGHHFGLADEYQQTAADHERETGEAAPVGDAHGDGTDPGVVAQELHTALTTPPRAQHGVNTLAVIRSHGIEQGAYAQQVAQRYLNMFGLSIVADCNRLIDEHSDVEGDISNQRRCTQPFLYTEENLMGGAETQGHAHEHDVAPRHVRHLCAMLGQAVGGIWEPDGR
jgi:peptidoglycan hydrolase-like protein with peptidoglycan-binding domain